MQLRGSQIVFKGLFAEEVSSPVVSLTKIQGRSQDLNRLRNECLLERYYYTARKNGPETTYEYNVKQVAAQFFLSPYHASKIILGHSHQLTALKLQWKNESIEKMQKHFAKKWGHLNW